MRDSCVCSFSSLSPHRFPAFLNFEIYNKVLTTRLPCVVSKESQGSIESSVTKRNVYLNILSLYVKTLDK